MIKMTMFLKRKAGMSHEDFVKHHIEVHGPKFRSIPEAEAHSAAAVEQALATYLFESAVSVA